MVHRGNKLREGKYCAKQEIEIEEPKRGVDGPREEQNREVEMKVTSREKMGKYEA